MIKTLFLLIAGLCSLHQAHAFELRLSLDSAKIRAESLFHESALILTDQELSVALVCVSQTLQIGKSIIPFTSPDQETCLRQVENIMSLKELGLISQLTFSIVSEPNGERKLETILN